MRPLVSASIALAAAVLLGAAVVRGPSIRSDERPAPGAPAPDAPSAAAPAAQSPPAPASPPAAALEAAEVSIRSAALPHPPPPHLLAPAPDFSRLALASDLPDGLPAVREFFFTRAIYSGRSRGWGGWGGGRGQGAWATDYPKADHQFMVVVNRLTNLDGYDLHNAVSLDDPNIRRFPFLYALEVGSMRLTDPEIEGLRRYLEAGGFLVIDDFWGTYEWANFEREIRRVLPGREIVELPMDHPIFRSFYNIEEVRQVPGIGRGMRGGPTHERDGYVPHVRGIFDDDGRLMVVINFNTDLGDAWEHAESPYYPLEYSTYAYEMGVNMIVYGMSH